MDDDKIVALFPDISDEAIKKLSSKCGKAIYAISYNIPQNKEASEK